MTCLHYIRCYSFKQNIKKRLLTLLVFTACIGYYLTTRHNYRALDKEHTSSNLDGKYKITTNTILPNIDDLSQHVESLLNDIDLVPDPAKSTMILLGNGGPYQVGDYLSLMITLYNRNGDKLKRGGDVLRLWAKEVNKHVNTKTMKTNVAGDITYIGDGSYQGRILLPWKSKIRIYCNISQTHQAIDATMLYTNKYGLSHGIDGRFVANNSTIFEDTPCAPIPLIVNFTKVCNLTKMNEGVPWYCGRPSNEFLTCGDWKILNTKTTYFIPEKYHEKIRSQMHMKLKKTIDIDVTEGNNNLLLTTMPCHKRQRQESWLNNSPSGYYYKDTWYSIGCKSTFIRSKENYINCLRGRHLLMIGDSNARTFADFFRTKLQLEDNYPRLNLDRKWFKFYFGELKDRQVTVAWKIHDLPFYGSWPFHDKRIYYPPTFKLIDKIPKGNNSIVLIHLWLHWIRAPFSVFRSRVQQIRDSVKHLLQRSPAVDVIIKGPHSMIFPNDLLPLDYLYKKHLEIWKSEFKDLMDRVIFLDEWSITLATENVHHHPPGDILNDMIDNFFSYICELG